MEDDGPTLTNRIQMFYVSRVGSPNACVTADRPRASFVRWVFSDLNAQDIELFMLKPWRLRDYFKFEIIINVLVGSFWFYRHLQTSDSDEEDGPRTERVNAQDVDPALGQSPQA